MKILHFITSIDQSSGGVAAYLQLLSKKLGEMVDLHIVTSSSLNTLSILNAEVHFIPMTLTQYFIFKKTYFKLLQQIKPDILHINGIWQVQPFLAQKWAQKLGIKVVVSPHGMLEPYILNRHPLKKKLAMALFQNKALKTVDIFHATAQSEKDNLIKLGIKQNIVVVPNAIETDGIGLKMSWVKTNTILFLSRIHPKKGLELLFAALHRLKKEGIILSLRIAGEGEADYIEELKNLKTFLGISDQIEFLGGVYGNRKWNLFKAVDAFILPTYSENFGIVIGESLVCGTPVITTTGTPWQDLETHGCGWWLDQSVENLSIALRQLVAKTPNELEQMGQMGRKLVLENYTVDLVAGQMVNLYLSLHKQ